MQKKIALVAAIFLLIFGFIAYEYILADENNLSTGNINVLVLCVDPSEQRGGMGGIDTVIVLSFKNWKINGIKPVFPANMYHPTAIPPLSLQQHHARCKVPSHYYLHDCLWEPDNAQGAKLAKETFEYNTGIKTNFVIMINPQAVDAIINALGPLKVQGQGYVNGSSIDLIRDEQYTQDISRVNAVKSLANSIHIAIHNTSKYPEVLLAILTQYIKGNIVVVPWDSSIQFAIGWIKNVI